MSKTATGILLGLVVAVAIGVIVVALARFDLTGKGGNRLSGDFNYDQSQFEKIDPALIGYRPAGGFRVELPRPSAISVAPGGIYVAAEKALGFYDRDGRLLLQTELSGRPTCLTVQGQRLYIGMADHVEILPAGVLNDLPAPTAWPKLQDNALLTSIAADDDAVFLADFNNRRILRCDLEGNVAAIIGKRDVENGVPGFVVPSPYFDLALDRTGRLLAADTGRHRVETYSREGQLLGYWGQPGPSIEDFLGCCNPCHFALLKDGRIVTSEKGVRRVKLYGADGRFECVVAGPAELAASAPRPITEEDWPMLAADGLDVLVLDGQTGTVTRFVPKTASSASEASKDSGH
jgi:sugar lactone lactonase YvrE